MKTKIFEKIEIDSLEENKSEIEILINNDLSLSEKMTNLRNSLKKVKLSPNGENELIKILFSNISKDVYFPRKGDNSERFDAIVNFTNYSAVLEVEMPSSAILDAPRNLLDDYAVLKSRKHESAKPIIPLVVCWDLPNKRTDYWNVITDIENVLGIQIKTISILALALHHWTSTKIDLTNNDYFLTRENPTMNKSVEILKSQGLSENTFAGYFSPYK